MITRIVTLARLVWMEMLRRKDIYVLLILLGALLLVVVSMDVFGLGGMVRYVMDAGLLLAWIFGWILAVLAGSRQIPQEETRGTIFPLLAKPVTRFELLAGKFLGTWTVISAATLVFYVAIIAVTALKGARPDMVAVFQGYVLHCAALGILCATAMLFSTRMNSDASMSLTFVFSTISFIVVPRIPHLVTLESGLRANALLVVYHLLPHFEVFDLRKRIVHDYGPAQWHVFCLVLIYGALVTAFLLLLAWLAFRRKRFSRAGEYGA